MLQKHQSLFLHSQSLWVHLKNDKGTGQLLLCVSHKPPDSSFHEELNENVSCVDLFHSTHTDRKVVIYGDFNGLDKNSV